MQSITNYLTESKSEEKTPLTAEEREQVKSKFGNSLECSFAKDKNGKFYCYTHRCRSKKYDSIDSMPKSKVDFVSSTS